jgi:hypothetical protein
MNAWRHSIDLGCHYEIVLVQPFDLLRAQRHRRVTPAEADVWVMAYSIPCVIAFGCSRIGHSSRLLQPARAKRKPSRGIVPEVSPIIPRQQMGLGYSPQNVVCWGWDQGSERASGLDRLRSGHAVSDNRVG